MRNTISATALAIVIASVAASSAEASTFLWENNGAGCVPGDTAIFNNLYLDTGGSIKFQSGVAAHSTITVYCPVVPRLFLKNGINANLMTLTYALSGTSSISAQLIKLSLASGSLTTVGPVLNGTNSSGLGAEVTQSVSETFDFTDYYYYVRIDMTLGAIGNADTLFGIALDG